jgi:hypothetical protein
VGAFDFVDMTAAALSDATAHGAGLRPQKIPANSRSVVSQQGDIALQKTAVPMYLL